MHALFQYRIGLNRMYDSLWELLRASAEYTFHMKGGSRHSKLTRLYDVMVQSRYARCRAERPRGAQYRKNDT